MAELQKKSDSTVAKQLADLKKKQLVEYHGANKTGGYFVKWTVVLLCGKICWHFWACLAKGSSLMECKDGAYKPVEPDEIEEKCNDAWQNMNGKQRWKKDS